MKFIDLTGQTFGRLRVIDRAGNLYGTGTAWRCRCTCGTETITHASSLRRGLVNSCGCLRRNDHPVITYEAAHLRIRQAKGPAEQQICIDCGQRARHWSYNFLDPQQVVDQTRPSKPYYSLNPDYYEPRCASCHKLADRAQKASVSTETKEHTYSPTHGGIYAQ